MLFPQNSPSFVKCCYQFTNKITKEGPHGRKAGKMSSELYSKPAIKKHQSPTPEEVWKLPVSWDLSCRQAQKTCGRGDL